MSAKPHFLLIAGPADQMAEVHKYIEMAQETEIANFTKIKKFNEHCYLLVYPKNLEPRLEKIRLLTKEFPDLAFNYYRAEETLVIQDTTVHSEH
ncbi:MAG: hypothetical protein AAGA85_01885 [Bacteroidota bacterium]